MINLNLFYQIYNLSGQNPVLDQLMIIGAETSIYIVFLLVALITILGRAKEKKAALLIILSLAISLLIIKVIRNFYLEARPFVSLAITPLIQHMADASFPSTHSSAMASVAFTYTFYKSKFALLFLILMLWVGFARIFVGVHYPLDILGGFLVGLLSVSLSWIIKKWLKKKLFAI